MKWVLTLVLTLWAIGARAEDRTFGGCTESGSLCAGPEAGVSLVIIRLQDKSSSAGFVPGGGYGVSWFNGEWYETGLSLYLKYEKTTSDHLFVAGVVDFAKYLRIGVGVEREIGVHTEPVILFGVGPQFD